MSRMDPLKRPPTRKEIAAAWLGLQSVYFGKPILPRRSRAKIRRAMEALDGVARDMRRKAIFQAGAKARKPHGKFEGDDLGSMERMNFFDGYASTHCGFKNPYRSVR